VFYGFFCLWRNFGDILVANRINSFVSTEQSGTNFQINSTRRKYGSSMTRKNLERDVGRNIVFILLSHGLVNFQFERRTTILAGLENCITI
jgi:hypothetical protein